MNRKEAEDYIYESYLRAEKVWKYDEKDEKKRNPRFSKKIIDMINSTPAITITGSKGKGSVANMVSQILSSTMNVGLMTSPHIIEFNERFKVAGKQISDGEIIYYVEKTRQLFAEIQAELAENECISPIGIQCVLALLFFKDRNTDINIFEGGKGVKYDDVNNVFHEYAIINTVFLEHTRELGESIEEIAEDKACIITGNEKCVYVAEQKEEVYEIINNKAEQKNVLLKVYGRDFYADKIEFSREGMRFDVVIEQKVYKDICIPLLGVHQAKNCALALAVCNDIMDISKNLNMIKSNLRFLEWPGRMEIISQTPFVLLDACINRESACNVVSVVRKLGIEEVTCIIGVPDDKDYEGVAKVMLNISKHIILAKSSNKHYIFTTLQRENIEKVIRGSHVLIDGIIDIIAAWKMALKDGKPIIILGTTSLVADVKRINVEEVLKNV